MIDLTQQLAAEDPVAGDAALTATEAAAIRRQLMDVVDAPHAMWTWTATLAAALAILVAAGAVVTRRVPSAMTPTARREEHVDPSRRQMQFETHNGTQVIWIFNERFDSEVQ